jgi:CRP-like cAMP-binding protein
MTILNILSKVPIFRNIKDEDLRKIEGILKEKQFAEGEHIFSEEDQGDEFYVVYEGRIKIYKMSSEGQIKALAYLQKGDFFGEMALLDKSPRSANALTMQDSRLFIIRYEDFQKFLINQPKILLTITQTLCQRLRRADLEIEMFSFKKVRERLILCLVDLVDKYGEETSKGAVIISRAFTHKDLSELVGTAREVITRLLKDLEQEKLIKKDNHNLVIPSVAKLKEKISD